MRRIRHLGLALTVTGLLAATAMPAVAITVPGLMGKPAAVLPVSGPGPGMGGGGGGFHGGGGGGFSGGIGGGVGALLGGLGQQPMNYPAPQQYYPPTQQYSPPPQQYADPPPGYAPPPPPPAYSAAPPVSDMPDPPAASPSRGPAAPASGYQAADKIMQTGAGDTLAATAAATPAPSDPISELVNKAGDVVDKVIDHNLATTKAIWEEEHGPAPAKWDDGGNIDLRNPATVAYQENSSNPDQMVIIEESHQRALAEAQIKVKNGNADAQTQVDSEKAFLATWNANIVAHAPGNAHQQMIEQRNIMLPGAARP
jgi:hypothetical protein